MDACRSLAELGAVRVVLMTFHGAPLHAAALDAGVRLLEARGVRAIQPFNLLMNEMLHVDATQYGEVFGHVQDPSDRAAVLRELATDFHAGFGETSLTLHYAPTSVSAIYKTLPPCPTITPDAALDAASRAASRSGRADLAVELRFAAIARGWAKLRPFPGYTGRPHLASGAAGAALARRVSDGYATATRAVFDGQDGPRPIMPWAVRATLGGRIPGIAVPLSEVAGSS
jgi:creatinine amidohydrolase